MSDDRELLTYDQAVALLNDGEDIHVFSNPAGGVLVGSDFSRAKVLEILKEAKEIEVGGEACVRMKHGLVADRRWFIESRAGLNAPLTKTQEGS